MTNCASQILILMIGAAILGCLIGALLVWMVKKIKIARLKQEHAALEAKYNDLLLKQQQYNELVSTLHEDKTQLSDELNHLQTQIQRMHEVSEVEVDRLRANEQILALAMNEPEPKQHWYDTPIRELVGKIPGVKRTPEPAVLEAADSDFDTADMEETEITANEKMDA